MTDEPADTSELTPEPAPTEAPTEAPYRSTIAVYSHEQRTATLKLTRAAFDEAGCPIEVEQIQTARPSQAGNRRNAYAAIKTALEQHVRPNDLPGLLLLEDDVIPATTLGAWLAFIERTQERPVTLYTPSFDKWYPQRLWRVARGERPATNSEIATIEPQTLRGWWGSQAVWLPTEWVEMLVRDARMQAHEQNLGPWDHSLRRVIQERGATLGVAVPNVVQHREERNLVTPAKRPSKSASFTPSAPAPATESR